MRNMSHSVLCEQAMIKLSLSNSVVTEAGGEKSYGIPELLNHQCDDVAIDGPDLTGHLKLAFATEADGPQPEWSVSGGSLSYGFDVVEVYLKSECVGRPCARAAARAVLSDPSIRGLPLRASGRPLPLLDCHDRQHDPQFPSFAQVHSA